MQVYTKFLTSTIMSALLLVTATPALAQESPSPSPPPASGASPSPASAQQQSGTFEEQLSKLSPEDRAKVMLYVIKLSQNPIGNITIVPFQNNWNYAIGPYARFQYNLNLQPVFPIMLSKDMTLVARTIVPVVVQPSNLPPTACPGGNCGSTFGMGDIQQQLFFAPKTAPGKFSWGAGAVLNFPTGQPQNVLGSGKWAAGPAVVGLVTPGKWMIGLLATQAWSYAGKSNYPPVSSGLFQPIVNFTLSGGWTLATAPIITVNYEAPGNQKWAVPIGGGVAKTFKAGSQLVQTAFFYYSFVQKPLYAPQTNVRLLIAFLWPLKRGFDVNEILQSQK